SYERFSKIRADRHRFRRPDGPKNLHQFVEVFSEQSLLMVDQLEAVAGKGPFSLWKYLTSYTMDSVCETALGIKVDAQRNPNQPFLEAFDQHCQMASWRICQPPITQQMYKYLPIYKLYMNHINWLRAIRAPSNIKYPNSTDKELKTFLELYIKASGGASGFTNVELREETLVLLLAGTDTSAVGSAFTSLMLARHPEVQNNVYEEIREVLGDSNRSVSAEDLPRLKYLEAVIKESLRLYPPVPIIVRKADKDIKLLYWGKDAEEFRPERFLESNLKHPAAFIPFSYGPRSCLGKGFLRTNNSKAKTSPFLILFQYYNSQRAI
ncbi:Uncharacterized protein OBRU01_23298, partial [Operophtera brumata]